MEKIDVDSIDKFNMSKNWQNSNERHNPAIVFWVEPLLRMTSSPSAFMTNVTHAEVVAFECFRINMVPNLPIQVAYFACTSMSCD